MQPTYPQAPDVAMPPKKKGDGLGVAALVLGIVSLALFWVPFLNVVFIVCGFVGLILGLVGISTSHRGMSIAGVSLGAAGIVLGIVVNYVVSDTIDEAANTPAPSAARDSHVVSPAQLPPPEHHETRRPAAIGETVEVGDVAYTVTKVTHAKSVGPAQYGLGETAQGEFTIVHLTVKNVGDTPVTFSDTGQHIVDTEGRKYAPNSMADVYLGQNGRNTMMQRINPGNSVSGKVAFDLPKDAAPDTLRLTTGLVTGTHPVVIDLSGS